MVGWEKRGTWKTGKALTPFWVRCRDNGAVMAGGPPRDDTIDSRVKGLREGEYPLNLVSTTHSNYDNDTEASINKRHPPKESVGRKDKLQWYTSFMHHILFEIGGAL